MTIQIQFQSKLRPKLIHSPKLNFLALKMPIFWHLMEVNLKQLKQKEAVKIHLNVGAQAAGV